jgi:hypothetical protein
MMTTNTNKVQHNFPAWNPQALLMASLAQQHGNTGEFSNFCFFNANNFNTSFFVAI